MSTDVEERVRRALAARAGQITPDRLQPAVPPTVAPARRSWLPWWRSLLAVAAVLVAVVLVVRLPGDTPPSPVPNAPAATVPSPAPSSSASPTPDAPTVTPSARNSPASPPAEPTPSLTTSETAVPDGTEPLPAPATTEAPEPAESPVTSPTVAP